MTKDTASTLVVKHKPTNNMKENEKTILTIQGENLEENGFPSAIPHYEFCQFFIKTDWP